MKHSSLNGRACSKGRKKKGGLKMYLSSLKILLHLSESPNELTEKIKAALYKMAACSSRGNQWLITLLGHTELMTGHYSVLRIIWPYSTVKVAYAFRSGTLSVFLC